MKHKQIIQNAAAITVAILLMAAYAMAGDATINGTMTNSGTFIVKSGLGGSVTSYGGTVEFGAAGDQTIPSGFTFEKLECTTSGNKTFAGTVTVSDYIRADAAAVNISTYRLVVTSANANPVQIATTGSFNFTTGEVEYALDGSQTIYGTTYNNLITSGATAARVKTTGGAVTITGTLTNGANTTLDFGSNTFTANSGAVFANSATLRSASTVTVDATAAINGTFEYSGTAQAVAPANYINLTLSNGTHTLSGTTRVAGVYTPGGGARTYAGTLEYNGTGVNQSVAGESNYASVILSGGNSKVLAGAASVGGDLTLAASTPLNMNGNNVSLAGNLVLGSNVTTGAGVLTMTSTTAANVSGAYEVIGAVNRTHSFTLNTAYAFNRPEVTLAVANTGNLNVTLTNNALTSPTAGTGLGSKYVNRQYRIAGADFTGNAATLKLYYTNANLAGAPNENRLVFRKYGTGAWTTLASTSYTRNVGSDPKDITLAGITDNFSTETELGMILSGYVTFAAGVWNNGGTWEGGDIPSATDDAEIQHAVTMGGGNQTIANLSISNTGTLTVDSNILTATSVANSGTFTVATGAAANLTGTFTNNAGANLNTVGTGALTINADLINNGSISNAGRITVE
jgi:hypothetical protein